MLVLNGVTAGYGNNDVVCGVSLTVTAGASVALLGPNGAGKSTLLKAVTGLLRRRSGEILLNGVDVITKPSHMIVAQGLSCVPEGRLIFGPLSVADNLRLGAIRLRSNSGHSLAERFQYVYDLFPRLEERQNQRAGTLSGGEQQMLAIGRALMSAPRVLLLDEPFLGLAPLIIDEILKALANLRRQGLAMLLVEQKVDIALAVASRAYVLIKGEIVLTDTAETLRKRGDLSELYFSLQAATTSTKEYTL